MPLGVLHAGLAVEGMPETRRQGSVEAVAEREQDAAGPVALGAHAVASGARPSADEALGAPFGLQLAAGYTPQASGAVSRRWRRS
jgi:hypothetical protein